MTHISWERARRSCSRAVRGAAALGLAALLAWGQVPAAAWAEAADAVAGAAQGTPAATVDNDPAADQTGGSANSGAGVDAGASGSPAEEHAGAASAAENATGAAADSDTAASSSSAADAQKSASAAVATDEAEGASEGAQGGAANAAVAEDDAPGISTLAEETINVSAQVFGRNAAGDVEPWTGAGAIELPVGSTAADASEQLFSNNKLTADYGEGDYGWYLNTITDPADATRALGWDEATGRYWQLFVNGMPSDEGAGSVDLKPGDQVVWFYSAYGESLPGSDDNADDVATVTASLTVVGQSAAGTQQTWLPRAQMSLPEGSTAADLTERLFAQYGLAADTGVGEYGWYLNSITDPADATRVLGWDATTGAYWQLFVNGAPSDSYASGVELEPGDEIMWYYAAYGAEAPEGDVTTNPDAEHPDVDAAWPGYANGGTGAAVEGVSTPTEAGDTAWKHSLLSDEERAAGASVAASDPLIINGKIYMVSGSSTYDASNDWAETKSLARLTVIDAATGAAERTVPLARGLDSVCRMVYADGIIVIPLASGYLQAVSASTLETLWVVDAIDGAQSLSTLTVSDGYVYVATADSLGGQGGMYGAQSGTLRRVDLYTGALVGSVTSDTAGYYWAGGIAAGDYFVIGDDAGEVVVYTADLSQRLSSTKLSAYVHASLVRADGKIYAVTSDGTFYQLELNDDGVIREVASCRFASSSTSTPTIVDGTAYVGGCTANGTGVLAVIDVDTMTVSRSVTSYNADGEKQSLPADVKSNPLVSKQASGTYVYFTCNKTPGGIYLYRVGDENATMLFMPGGADQNYSMSSIICGPDGMLYYTNDSGNLFAIKGVETKPGNSDKDPNGGNPNDGDPNGKNPNDTGNGGDDRNDVGGRRGTVSPALRPVSDSAVAGAGDESVAIESAAAENAEGEAEASDAGVAAASARMAARVVGESGERGLPRWVPVTGIVVGVCGLAAIGAYLTLLRRRSV